MTQFLPELGPQEMFKCEKCKTWCFNPSVLLGGTLGNTYFGYVSALWHYFVYRWQTVRRICAMQCRGWPLTNMPCALRPPPLGLPCWTWSLLVKRYESIHGDPPDKLGPSRPAFQGHSRSSALTRIDTRYLTFYKRSVVIMVLSCSVSMI